MATSIQPRRKDHWSVRLHVKRPTTRSRLVPVILAAILGLLFILTASAIATGGGLYGCSSACGTAALPETPAIAVLLGMIMLVLPPAIGFFSETWQGAITGAALPWLVGVLVSANGLLAPTAAVVAGSTSAGSQHGHSATAAAPVSQFGPPFWLDSGHALALLLSLALFVLLAWIGWSAGQALKSQ